MLTRPIEELSVAELEALKRDADREISPGVKNWAGLDSVARDALMDLAVNHGCNPWDPKHDAVTPVRYIDQLIRWRKLHPMSLFLLETPPDDSDYVASAVVRAATETAARQILTAAREQIRDRHAKAWITPTYTTCKLLLPDGPEEVLSFALEDTCQG
jgi:hypothetical protein